MLDKNRKLKVFLCHSSQDKPIVREVYQHLLSEGWIDPWLDEKKLIPGHDWNLEIEKAVEAADAVIVFLSNSSLTKEGYIQKEIKKVLDISDEKPEGSIFIIPVRLQDCEPPRRLSKWQYVDYFSEVTRSNSINLLLRSLKLRGSTIGIKSDITQSVNNNNIALAQNKSNEGFSDTQFNKIYQFGEIDFVKVGAGDFVMGTYDSNLLLSSSDSSPEHAIYIPYDYWIGRFPLTEEQYAKFLQAQHIPNERRFWTSYDKNHPITLISWDMAMEYCNWLNRLYMSQLPKGYIFRLPTEAEWEKAARGSIDRRKYPWGDELPNKNRCHLNYKNMYRDGGNVTPVGKYSPQGDSFYGCSDMLGNVKEWTHSKRKPYPYNPKDGREENPIAKNNNDERVLRGGDWTDSPQNLSLTTRFSAKRSNSIYRTGFGFRVAVTYPIGKVISLT